MGYSYAMDPITQFPKDRKPSRPLRLVLLMGMTVLLFLLMLNRYGQVADSMMAARAGI